MTLPKAKIPTAISTFLGSFICNIRAGYYFKSIIDFIEISVQLVVFIAQPQVEQTVDAAL